MSLIRYLQELQDEHGYLTEEALRDLARRENVPLHRLQSLVSFYPHFRTNPSPAIDIAVCRDMSCWLGGAPQQCRRLQEEAAHIPGSQVREVSCLGRCDMAPAGAINDLPVSLPDVFINQEPMNNLKVAPRPETARRQSGWRMDPYATSGERYNLLRDLLKQDRERAVKQILTALKDSGLRGMGGAGFSTATKWDLVRNENRVPKYVICNADESEPGTFKDRVILAELSHLVIEGIILAGLVVGSEHGILFIRHEYGPELRAFQQALDEARQILVPTLGVGTHFGDAPRRAQQAGFNFYLEIFVSPGGYILGEETALLEALEDKRGEPRNKPPFPGSHGLHGLPALINNVETLAVVPAIVRRGSEWWRAQGKKGFQGLKFMAISGHVERPGVYEVPFGTTVRELLEMAGGVKGGRALKAFAPGGASSPFLPASMIDLPLDFETVSQAGSMLGSGAVVVVAEGTDMLALATNVVCFFRNESCGKCVPCREGSQKAVEILERAQSGQKNRSELELLPELGETLALTSICGLGQAALNPILSVMKHWPEEVQSSSRG
jgi:NADH:ubiquinone oxidoreductase subunit F (NADH-binding)